MIPEYSQEKALSFFKKYPTAQYKKGDMILEPQDSITSIFYLLDGYIRMYSIFPDGRELTLNIFKPGSFFPLFLAFGLLENTYFYEAMTPSHMKKAPATDVVRFVKENPDVLFDFTKRISSGFHGLLTNIQYQLFGSVHRKITSTILLLSKRFGEHRKEGILINLPLTHQDLAHLTGVARETASLELEKLQKQKFISYAHKKITILNMRALEQEVSMEEQIGPVGLDM